MAQVARNRHKQWASSNKYYRDDEYDASQGRSTWVLCLDLPFTATRTKLRLLSVPIQLYHPAHLWVLLPSNISHQKPF